MADLRKRFVEDYAGGLLNIARQELSTTGEVLAQDGLTSDGTLFVEDGSGVKSGLKLGVGLAEVVDPTTEIGVVNVRYANRTYAKTRDLKLFSTAVASAQAALSEATSTSISNVETTLQLLEDDLSALEQNLQQTLVTSQQQLDTSSLFQRTIEQTVEEQGIEIQQINEKIVTLENPTKNIASIQPLDTSRNNFYYPGTIEIDSGIVTGVDTDFNSSFSIGDVFVAYTSTGEEVEFQVTDFSTTTPETSMSVRPNNKTVDIGSRYEKARFLEIRNKINEILTILKA